LLQSVEVDSPLLMSIPPAMFRSIIMRLDMDDKHKVIHTCSLVAAYLENNVEDKSVVDIYFCAVMPIGPWFRYVGISEDTAIEFALTWFRLMKKKGWNLEDDDESCFNFYDIERVNRDLSCIIDDYLRSKTPSLEMMERIVRGVPSDIVAKCFRDSVDEAGLAAKDIKFVRNQSRCRWETAVRALKENDGDATEAIRSLTHQVPGPPQR